MKGYCIKCKRVWEGIKSHDICNICGGTIKTIMKPETNDRIKEKVLKQPMWFIIIALVIGIICLIGELIL
jgi:hypothetical protein